MAKTATIVLVVLNSETVNMKDQVSFLLQVQGSANIA
jgi:hypothetical protein